MTSSRRSRCSARRRARLRKRTRSSRACGHARSGHEDARTVTPARRRPYTTRSTRRSYSISDSTFIGDLYRIAAARKNIAGDGGGSPYPQLTQEAIIAANPQVIVLADRGLRHDDGLGEAARRLAEHRRGEEQPRLRDRPRHREPRRSAHRRRARADREVHLPEEVPVGHAHSRTAAALTPRTASPT